MRKKDEMEQEISNKSVKMTWVVTIIALFIVGYSELFFNINFFNSAEGYRIIALMSVTLYIFLDKFYFSRVTDKKNFIKFAGGVLLLTLIMIWVTFFLVS